MTNIRTLGAAAALACIAHSGAAQQPNASAAAFGMAGNFMALATGSNAVAWNPAMLGMNSPAFSLNLFSAGGVTGLDPVKLTPQGGTTITKSVPLATGNSTAKIDFSDAELKSLLGKLVSISYSGAVNATAGAVNISPKQAVVVTTRLDINLQVGG